MMEVIRTVTNGSESDFESAQKNLLRGATETDIVYAGLEEVMSEATIEVIKIAERENLDLRTAAYVLALTRLNDYYLSKGMDI